jgi:RNA polymerase sigma factor (sigma-70 family)
VYRITVSEIRRASRRSRRDHPLSLDDSAVEAMPHRSGDDPNSALFVRAGLRDALAALSVRERTVIALRYVDDLSDHEIARAMGCRPGTVRSLLSRARTRLSRHPALEDHAEARRTSETRPLAHVTKETNG